jgi:hypothetical protein
MILNVATVVSFFLAALGGLLAAAAIVVALATWWAQRRAPTPTRRQTVENGAHLLVLLLGVLGLVRLLAWPHFYWLMKSYVPTLAQYGVMCVFGVTRIQPHLVLALQIVKPLALLGIGLWWAVTRAHRRDGTRALLPAQLALAVPVAGLALVDSALEARYLLSEKIGQRVTCCTQFLRTDAASLPPGGTAWFVPADASSQAVLGSYLAANLLVIAGCIYLGKRGLPSNRPLGALLGLAAALGGAANLVVAHWAWIEALAPKVLQLPYHHCLYELLTDTPALGLAALMTVAGNGCLIWPAVLQLWRSRAPQAVDEMQRHVYELAAVALASALLIAVVHAI